MTVFPMLGKIISEGIVPLLALVSLLFGNTVVQKIHDDVHIVETMSTVEADFLKETFLQL